MLTEAGRERKKKNDSRESLESLKQGFGMRFGGGNGYWDQG